MFETILLLGVVALGIIAYQLQGIRHALEENAQLSALAREQAELDEMILDACPNVFYQLRAELRDWFAIHQRKRAYYEEHKSFGDAMSPHSDEESSWHDIFQRLLKGANDEQKLALGAVAALTDNFLQEAAARTVLKPAEMNFFAFQAWRDFLSEGGDAIVLGIIKSHLQESLDSQLQAYRRSPGSDGG